tara:strand:- start:1879 stop:2115 length:237 start_codon:yes stop_codon:yes gene_type:complete
MTARIANAAFKTWADDPYERVLRERADSLLWRIAHHAGSDDELGLKLSDVMAGLTETERERVDGLAAEAMLTAARQRR